jgi:hypothetical protein
MKLEQLNLKAKPSAWRHSVPVFACATPPLEQRHAAARRMAEQLQFGGLRQAELDHGLVMASARGDITVFHASGGLLARHAAASADFKDERRDWPGLAPATAGADLTLTPDAAKRLIDQADRFFKPMALIGREAMSPTVQLDQVARLNGQGKEVERGAGQAQVRWDYRVEGLLARGAGAKTLMFVEPAASGAVVAGAYHGWRPLGAAKEVKLPAFEEALSVALLHDPELDQHAASGGTVTVTQIELVYLALPVFMRQSHLFPVLQVEGVAEGKKPGEEFHFARYHHAVPPAAYAAADLHGAWLALNPDGIAPALSKADKKGERK